MSARTEQLLTEISDLEKRITEEKQPMVKASLETHLASLRKQLTQANEALTEGRQILKG
jgi:hypothetical protein